MVYEFVTLLFESQKTALTLKSWFNFLKTSFALMFCTDLRTDSGLSFVRHELIGFYNRGGKCLQRGTD